ncbi:hypothetical protein OG948_50110 (plasmid) [Embleya sp. NBC_00888]|uniref:PEP/pyruvate-binding domain-containing protein n=1 Tax=Embleya sp. NBC_00888 TaxID=2975960 RepID=UPI002F9192E7|nr:hypothetical protein OG948_50110 [Embleya sp. NBC_00888]
MAVEANRMVVVPLEVERAHDPRLTGGKAAQLARAAAAGLPVLPGFVLVPATRAPDAPHGEESLRRAWHTLAEGGSRSLIVRSSSVHEDTATSSMAGRFATVADVRGWDAFTAAVDTVLDSARAADPDLPGDGAGVDGMAVLVQRMSYPVAGGVMFGADPVEGREDHILISAVPGSPARLVDGRSDGVHYRLTRRGRRLPTRPAEPPGRHVLGRRRLHRLVVLAGQTRRLFGAPQDMEFGFDADDRLWLFQSRPITAMSARPARGARLLGPGPVAETLPDVLQPLEEDLWVAPMAHGLAVALDVTGTAPRRRPRTVPVVRTVDGLAVADLRPAGHRPLAAPRPRHPQPRTRCPCGRSGVAGGTPAIRAAPARAGPDGRRRSPARRVPGARRDARRAAGVRRVVGSPGPVGAARAGGAGRGAPGRLPDLPPEPLRPRPPVPGGARFDGF